MRFAEPQIFVATERALGAHATPARKSRASVSPVAEWLESYDG